MNGPVALTPSRLSPGQDAAARWLTQIFSSRAAFLAEMRRRGFPVVENAGQYVIFCNTAPIRRLC
jgi:hypothetical protein